MVGPAAGELPTPRSIIGGRYLRLLLLTCQVCLHQTNADLQALVDQGYRGGTMLRGVCPGGVGSGVGAGAPGAPSKTIPPPW